MISRSEVLRWRSVVSSSDCWMINLPRTFEGIPRASRRSFMALSLMTKGSPSLILAKYSRAFLRRRRPTDTVKGVGADEGCANTVGSFWNVSSVLGERVAIDSEYNRHFSRMHGHG